MRKLLALNTAGQLALRAADGRETELRKSRPNVLLLMDTSGSMGGKKLQQVKSGAAEFTHSAVGKGYAVALAIFADRAAMVCDPTQEVTSYIAKLSALHVGLVGHTTDLAAGLMLASKFHQLAALVVITDGATAQAPALRAAAMLKERSVEIICIGTDDADKAFLQVLATRSDLAMHVPAQSLGLAIHNASRLLKG